MNIKPESIKKVLDDLRRSDKDLADELQQRILNSSLETVHEAPNDDLSAIAESVDTAANPDFVAEVIAVRVGRPVLIVEGNTFKLDAVEADTWRTRLSDTKIRDAQARVISAVGRIEVENCEQNWLGTGWLLKPDIIVTNRHVASKFAAAGGTSQSGFDFRPGFFDRKKRMSARINFTEKDEVALQNGFRILDVLHIEDDNGVDMAFLQVVPTFDTIKLPQPLILDTGASKADQFIAAVGYPAFDTRYPDQEFAQRLFGNVFNVKRFSPGQVVSTAEELIIHNCSTLGGNSGAPVADLNSGKIIGLHYGGRMFNTEEGVNYAIPSRIIEGRLKEVTSPKRNASVNRTGITKPVTEKSMEQNKNDLAHPAGGTVSVVVKDFNGDVQTISIDIPGPKFISVRAGGADTGVSSVKAVTKVEEAVNEVEKMVSGDSNILSVKQGFLFKDEWITNEEAVVVILRNSDARSQIEIPQNIGGFPVQVRDPGMLDLFEAPDFSVLEEVPDIAYKKLKDFSLKPVKAEMQVTCHLSPDAGWPTLEEFLKGTTERLTIGMYDFSALHIVDAVTKAIKPAGRTLDLVLQDSQDSLTGSVKEEAGDIPDTETHERLEKALKRRLNYASASTGKGGQFATAYHIKVAVRDEDGIWLSSGNWQSSNQNKNPVDTSSWDALKNLNREWHIVLENAPALAEQFRNYLLYDLENAQNEEALFQQESFPQFLVEEVLEEARTPATAPQYFAPEVFSRSVRIHPLLTPDNYFEEVLKFINSAKEQILFQNQSLSILFKKDGTPNNDPRYEELINALLEWDPLESTCRHASLSIL